MPTGTVIKWLDEKGFGFLKPDDPESNDVFCHVRQIEGLKQGLIVGQRVEYREGINERSGKMQALDVKVIS